MPQGKPPNADARTARSRNRPSRASARHLEGATILCAPRCAGGTCAFPFPSASPSALAGRTHRQRRAPRQISPARSRRWRSAGHASRHVRLVPHRGGGSWSARSTTSARRLPPTTTCFPHVERRDDHLQRPPPLRLHAADRAREGSPITRSSPISASSRPATTCPPIISPARFAARRRPLKAALLDQSIIAGLGNIYVCEALFRSGLGPERKAETLVTKGGQPSVRLERLVPVIRAVIAEAIEAGGSSLRDHAQPSGELGYFQHRFQVYDREGEPCVTPGCGAQIRRLVQSNRSTFYCPSCQR